MIKIVVWESIGVHDNHTIVSGQLEDIELFQDSSIVVEMNVMFQTRVNFTNILREAFLVIFLLLKKYKPNNHVKVVLVVCVLIFTQICFFTLTKKGSKRQIFSQKKEFLSANLRFVVQKARTYLL